MYTSLHPGHVLKANLSPYFVESGHFRHELVVPIIDSSRLQELVWIYCPGHPGVQDNEPAAGTIRVDKGNIVKTMYERMLAYDARIDERARGVVIALGIRCGSSVAIVL